MRTTTAAGPRLVIQGEVAAASAFASELTPRCYRNARATDSSRSRTSAPESAIRRAARCDSCHGENSGTPCRRRRNRLRSDTGREHDSRCNRVVLVGRDPTHTEIDRHVGGGRDDLLSHRWQSQPQCPSQDPTLDLLHGQLLGIFCKAGSDGPTPRLGKRSSAADRSVWRRNHCRAAYCRSGAAGILGLTGTRSPEARRKEAAEAERRPRSRGREDSSANGPSGTRASTCRHVRDILSRTTCLRATHSGHPARPARIDFFRLAISVGCTDAEEGIRIPFDSLHFPER